MVIYEEGTRAPDQSYEDILSRLPHRPPILLIERVDELISQTSAVGHKYFAKDSPFFLGHFPKRAVLPGIYVIEGMAQTAAMLIAVSIDVYAANRTIMLLSVDKVRYRSAIVPESHVRYEVRRVRQMHDIWRFSGQAVCNGQVAARCDFMAKLHD